MAGPQPVKIEKQSRIGVRRQACVHPRTFPRARSCRGHRLHARESIRDPGLVHGRRALCDPPAGIREQGRRSAERNQQTVQPVPFRPANPFAILVSSTEDGPFAPHLPVFVSKAGDQLVIRGHVAKANPHWRHLEQNSNSLTIFHGPHAYVSASNYTTRENVPTWNYGTVHVYGNARTFRSEEH